MTNEEDVLIRDAARRICAEQAGKQCRDAWERYISGDWDQTIWMHIVEKGILHGIKIGRLL